MEKSIYDPSYRRLRALLTEIREQAGLKQQEVADRLGKPQSFVSKYESGERRIDVAELRHIAHALDTTLLAIVTAFEEQERRLEENDDGSNQDEG